MDNPLAYIDYAAIGTSICVAIHSGIRRKRTPFLASLACFLFATAYSSSWLSDLSVEMLGFGIAWPAVGLTGILTWLFFRTPLRIGLKRYARTNLVQIMIGLSICYCLCVLPSFLFPGKSFRVIFSFILSIYVGWNVLGGLLAQSPSTIYKNILVIQYAGALIGLLHVVANFVLFSSISRGFWNPLRGGFGFVSRGDMRFQAELNAVALGYALTFMILIALNWIASSKSRLNKVLLLVIAAFLCHLLLLTGSRGSLLTLLAIGCVLLVRIVLLNPCPSNIRFITATVLVVLVILICANWHSYIKPALVARNMGSSISNTTIVEAFADSRVNISEEVWIAANQMGYDRFFGAGPGADAEIVNDSIGIRHNYFEIFFLRMFFNWGVIGGSFYILGMAALSYQVIKMERIERDRGSEHAWLATAWILIPWISSPFAYGFSIPGPELCLTFAIGAGSLAYCNAHATCSRECHRQSLMSRWCHSKGARSRPWNNEYEGFQAL